MSVSSIHIERGHRGYFFHNDRTDKTTNSIFNDEENYTNISGLESVQLFDKELNIRKEKYKERTGQNIQKNTMTHMSAIVNFNKEHTEEDMEVLIDYLEGILDTKVIQFSMHRDEGHYNKEGELERDDKGTPVKNYHCHLELLGLDSQGNSIRKKLDRKMLIHLQDKTSEILEMKRGRNFNKEWKEYQQNQEKGIETPKPRKTKRLNTHEYKRLAAEKGGEVVKVKDLQREVKKLKEEIKGLGGIREDYSKLEQVVKELRIEVKNKDLNTQQLELQIKNIKSQLLKEITMRESSEYTTEEVDIIRQDYERQLTEKDKRIKELEEEIEGEDLGEDYFVTRDLPALSTDTKEEPEPEHKSIKNLNNMFKGR